MSRRFHRKVASTVSLDKFILEQEAAEADQNGFGQDWVESTTPNIRRFTDDAGTDHIINTTLATEQAAAGTEVEFTGIPAGVKKIKVLFLNVSTNGTSPIVVQIGDTNGFATSGYTSVAGGLDSTPEYSSNSNGFHIEDISAATHVYDGIWSLYLKDKASFTWLSHHHMAATFDSTMVGGAGSKSLPLELAGVRVTTIELADTFDGGSFSIQYE